MLARLAGFVLILGVAACSKTQVVERIPDYGQQHCYRTLADVDCHSAPLPGEESREVGWYAPVVGYREIGTDFKCLDFTPLGTDVVRIGCTGP